jgi:hypothetical protein
MDIQERTSPTHHTDAPLIDLPRAKPIEDPQAYLRAMVQWHFGPDTGSTYWLKRAKWRVHGYRSRGLIHREHATSTGYACDERVDLSAACWFRQMLVRKGYG